MGVVEDRSGVLNQEQFEDLARHAGRLDEALRLEFIQGKIAEKAVPDAEHGRIIAWLMQICAQSLQGMWLFPDQGMRIEAYRKGNARPDGVLMVVEVTSRDPDTNQRDRVEKPVAYAETGIPVYLLVDRDAHKVSVFSEPDAGRYEQVVTVAVGKTVELPTPVGIALDTEPLKEWMR